MFITSSFSIWTLELLVWLEFGFCDTFTFGLSDLEIDFQISYYYICVSLLALSEISVALLFGIWRLLALLRLDFEPCGLVLLLYTLHLLDFEPFWQLLFWVVYFEFAGLLISCDICLEVYFPGFVIFTVTNACIGFSHFYCDDDEWYLSQYWQWYIPLRVCFTRGARKAKACNLPLCNLLVFWAYSPSPLVNLVLQEFVGIH